jgi:hypothetical protein
MSGGGETYDDQYESLAGAFGEEDEFVTTSLLYPTSHARSEMVPPVRLLECSPIGLRTVGT